MKTHIIDALRPERPDLDRDWEAETVRAILEDRAGWGNLTTERGGPRRLMNVALIAAAVVALIGGVIVARNSLPADDVRPAKPVQDKIQKIDPSKATKLKLDVVADLPKSFNGDQVFFDGYAENNVVVGAVIPVQTNPTDASPYQQSHPVMYDIDTKKLTILDDRDRPAPTQVVDVSGDQNTVVWAEVVGANIDSSEFTLYSYDRRTKQLTTIGTFSDPDGQIVYGNDLAIAGHVAYFSTAAYPAKRGQEAVYAVPVDGSKPASVIVKGGAGIRVSGNTLTYGVSNPKDKKNPTMYAYDLRTKATTPAPVSSHAGDPRFCGAEFSAIFQSWCLGRKMDGNGVGGFASAVLTIKENSGRTTVFKQFPTESGNNPLPHHLITLGKWTGITMTTDDGQDREFLVDLDTKDVKVFPDNTSFGSLSPDRSTVLISSYAGNGPGPQRIVRIPAN